MILQDWITNYSAEEGLPNSLTLPATTPDQLIQVIQLRYEAAHMFEKVIDYLLVALEDEGKSRHTLVDALKRNLQEERGEGENDYGPAHVLGRRSFFQALGINYQEWEARLGGNIKDLSGFHEPARNLIAFHHNLIEASPLAGGAAMLYWEGRIARLDYVLLLERVDAVFGFTPVTGTLPRTTPQEAIPARWHLQSHAEHDVFHEKELIEGVVGAVLNVSEEEVVRVALIAARTAWERMWGEILREVFS